MLGIYRYVTILKTLTLTLFFNSECTIYYIIVAMHFLSSITSRFTYNALYILYKVFLTVLLVMSNIEMENRYQIKNTLGQQCYYAEEGNYYPFFFFIWSTYLEQNNNMCFCQSFLQPGSG